MNAGTLTRDLDYGAPPDATGWARWLVTALLVAVALLILPTDRAFAEGSVDVNQGPGANVRHGLMVGASVTATPRSTIQVYAQAGETVQMASSLVGVGGTIRLFAPGANPATAPPLLDCSATQPTAGSIGSRAAELAGPQPSADPDAYVPCTFVAPSSGIYSVVLSGSSIPGHPGTVDAPRTDAGQGTVSSMWDVTVRDAGGAIQRGRAYSFALDQRTSELQGQASDFRAFLYTKTGYGYQFDFYEHAGLNWRLAPDAVGILDAATDERLFASYACGDESDPTIGRPCVTFDAKFGPIDRRYPVFFSPADPVAISGANGLAATRNYATAPISPASNPLSASFTGVDGQPEATNRGAGGTVDFTSPSAMEGLEYTLEIDTNDDGTFGNGDDVVVDGEELSPTGANSYAWDGRDAAGVPPACGTVNYRVRSTLSEVHFAMEDVENSGGTRIERLSLPTDPTLGNPLAASYDNRDPFKSGFVVTNGTPPFVVNGTSGRGFNSWTDNTGNTDFIDTWAQLPEVQATGTLRILCADLVMRKSAAPTVYQPGGDLAFTLEVENRGPDTAVNPVVVDTLAPELSVTSVGPGCSIAGQTVTCTLPSLASGARHEFRVVTRVATTATQCVPNVASVTSDTHDPLPTNNAASICVPPAQSDVSIVKSASPSPIVPGRNVTYRLLASNAGPHAALQTVITDKLPSELEFVSASEGCVNNAGTLTCVIPSLAAGASQEFTVTMKAPSSLAECPRNSATISSLTADTNPANNSDAVCPPLEGKTDLSIRKSVSAPQVTAGGQLMYTLVIENGGPSDATGVRVSDPLPPGVNVVSVQAGKGTCSTLGGAVTCNIGRLEAGATMQVLITATAPAGIACPVNTAMVAGNEEDTNPRNNSDSANFCTTITPPATFDLVVTKRADRKTVTIGQPVTYRIVVTNRGPAAAPDTKLVDTFGARGRVLSVRTTQGTCRRGTPVRCDLGTVESGDRVEVTIRLRPTTTGNGKRNVVSVTGNGEDRDPKNNISRETISVRSVALRLTKQVNRTVLRAGQTATYTIRVSNPTKGIAHDVQVCDDLPAGLVYVSSSPRAKLTQGRRCWPTIKLLSAGKSRTYRMTVRAVRGTSGKKVNTATASSPDSRTLRAKRMVRVVGGALRPGGVTG